MQFKILGMYIVALLPCLIVPSVQAGPIALARRGEIGVDPRNKWGHLQRRGGNWLNRQHWPPA
ncbi:hypothetical protein HYDPIDRAFT_108614 [Hydnomerulius pinastri MD-312]|nr:hypothetical protein HYDPIDRAFT_108614 [Hydnomerulius pinastri MD-312]